MIIQVILVAIAAIAKALYDTIIFHDGGKLGKKNPKYRNGYQGRFLPFTRYPFDPKHVSGTVMAGALIAAASVNISAPSLILFAVYSIIYITVFNTFWNKIFN